MKNMKRRVILGLLVLPLAMAAGGVAALHILDAAYPFPLRRIDDRLAAATTLIRASDQSTIAWRVDREDNFRIEVGLEEVSPWLIAATIATEDKRFREHRGVDPVAVCRAVLQNATSGRRVSGASTITMQTIRLLWQRPRRLDVKIREAFRAWQLERLVDKNRILEIYLNLAPYGGNILGVEAAARRYFGKSAKHLDLAEASLLAGLPQSPARLNPLRHPGSALRRRNFVIRRLLEDGRIDIEQARRAWGRELRLVNPEPRLEAAHFADFVLAGKRRNQSTVNTTLNPELQAVARRISAAHGETLAAKGVTGPAAVVLSVKDSSILAYVGNAAPEHAPARMVDGARAKRQPGSLLKPFIFALLAEKGRIAPSSRVYDLPHAWADYAPRNMDREWRGELTAEEALRQSRNVTAVKQLEQLGPQAFAAFMADMGMEPGEAGRYGLALALGAKEQTLLALANAYAVLARMGAYLPPRFDRDEPPAPPDRVISPGAAWLTLAAMASTDDRRGPSRAWKTGTSWNQLDAWAIVLDPEYVVGVWCGRTEKGGSGWVAGADDALPLALDLLEAVRRHAGPEAPRWEPPAGVEFREVCAESGTLPGWGCREVVASPMLTAVPFAAGCRRHSPVAAEREKAEPTARKETALHIVFPTHGTTYPVRGAATLPLLAESPGAERVTWFADGVRLGVAGPGQVFDWAPPPGAHRLSVGDGRGESRFVDITVETRP